MVKPAIYRIVSVSKKTGKTKLITLLAKELMAQGVEVAVIKHSVKGIDLKGKDTSRYASAGVKKIVFVSPRETVLFIKQGDESLNSALALLEPLYPIILVEGFKSEREGKIIGLISSTNDVRYYLDYKESIIALVCTSIGIAQEIKDTLYTITQKVFIGINKRTARLLAKIIVEDAIKYVHSQLPKLDCGHCGYATCMNYARALVLSLTREPCPQRLNVVLRVDKKDIPLGPYPKRIFMNVIQALINTLKGVPKDYKEVEVKISKD